jgi:hypothetical protein
MKKLLFIILLFPTLSFGSSWYLIGANDDHDFYIDKDSIVKSGNEVNYWVKINYKKKDEYGDLSEKQNGITNCRTKEETLKYYLTYTEIDNNGKIHRSGYVPIKWTPIVPDSVGETILKFVCKK